MNEVHLQSVGGELRIVTIPTPIRGTTKRYVALLTQVAAGDPSANLKDNTLLGVPIWARGGVGDYKLTLAGEFKQVNTIIKIGSPSALNQEILAFSLSDNEIGVQTANPIGTPKDDVLNNTTIDIEVISTIAPNTAELIFDYILTQLDGNQIKLWQKIVVRYGGIVTEIDGKKYRNTGVYATSNKVVES